MLLVNYMSIYCKCRECGYEDNADRTCTTIWEKSDCPKCGERAFSKKMYSTKISKIEIIDCKEKNKEHK